MFPLRMNSFYLRTFVLLIFMCFCVTVFSTDTDKCYLNSKTNDVADQKILKRISPLFGQVFRVEKDGFNYVVAICSDTSKLHANASVTKSKIKDDTIILGRRNETHVIGGDTWVLVRYECTDKYPNKTDKKCLGHHSASIYIVCDPQNHEESNIKLVEEDGCNYKFVLPCTNICEHDEEVSGSTLFFIVLSVVFFMYFIVGIIYRRLVKNAQGCQQLPHFTFWQRVGALLSDGCNYVCRCDPEQEESWNNITSNFDSGDRDDALLRP